MNHICPVCKEHYNCGNGYCGSPASTRCSNCLSGVSTPDPLTTAAVKDASTEISAKEAYTLSLETLSEFKKEREDVHKKEEGE